MRILDLTALGWGPAFVEAFESHAARGLVPARVALEHTHIYRVLSADGEWLARVSGRLRHEAAHRADFPGVGDWVAVEPPAQDGDARIHAVLPRFSRFSRRAAGDPTEEQIVAANINTVFLVSGLDLDFNPRRIERYLVVAWESGATPVVVLNKADLVDEPGRFIDEVQRLAPAVAVHAVSCRAAETLAPLHEYLRSGQTAALLGSSGVGKSSIVNRLLGQELLTVRDIREDDRGRHTTTFRRLVPIPGGGLLMDTPGMRTVLLWDGAEGLSQVFEEIEELGRGCRFRDCSHDREPGCAVREAAESGVLDLSRLLSYRKLRREERYMARKQDVAVRLADSRKWRVIHRAQRARPDKRSL